MNTQTYVKKAHAAYQARGGKKLSREEKMKRIAKLMASGGADKVAAAQVGPIIVRIAYEGVVRNLLLEDNVPQGSDRSYEVFDDLGVAYSLHSMDGRVKIERIEGKKVYPDYYRIASEWEVLRSDLELMNASTIEYAEDQTVQAIMEKEDKDFFALLEAALTDWTDMHTGADTDNEAAVNPNVIDNADNDFALNTFLEASARIASQRLIGTRLVMNPADVYDIYKWDIKTVGLTFKEDFIAGNKTVTFGDYQIIQSIRVPRGTIYMLPSPEHLGILSVRYGLEVGDDPSGISEFKIRKVYNELIAQLILNNRGITKIKK